MKNKLSSSILLLFSVLFLASCTKAPLANFTYTLSDQTVSTTFTGEGDDLVYAWDFGDGTIITTESATHTYIDDDSYTLTLTVSNKKGSDTKSETFEIELPRAKEGKPQMSKDDGDVMLHAYNKNSLSGTAVTRVASANAYFLSSGSKVEAGTVSVKSGMTAALTFNSTTSEYEYAESGSQVGFNANQGATWTLGAGGVFPAVNGIANLNPFPVVTNISSGTVTMSSTYTLRHDGDITKADSVHFIIYGPNATLKKTAATGVSEIAFTSTELETLGNGYGYIQIAGYKAISQTLGSNRYYMINCSYSTKSVRIKP